MLGPSLAESAIKRSPGGFLSSFSDSESAAGRPLSAGGVTLALANKESLVAAGGLALAAQERGGGRILPVDSEHSALFQCLEGRSGEQIDTLVLTGSGGPFRGRTRAELERVSIDDGKTWRVLVDTDEDADLRNEKILRPYGVAGEYGSFGGIANTTFGVQVYEKGDLLSIVTVSGFALPRASPLQPPNE